MEGGSANDYDYCFGDPVNCSDLTGTKAKKKRSLTPIEETRLAQLLSNCSGPDASGADISGSGSCRRFRSAFARGDLSEFGIGFTPRAAGDCPSWIKSTARFVGVGDAFRATNDIVEGRNPSSNAWSFIQSYALTKEAIRNATAAAKLGGGALTAGFTALDAVCTLH